MKLKIALLIIVLIGAGIMRSCKFPFQNQRESYVFSYSAFDSTNVKIVIGVMKFRVNENQKISGEWIFEQIRKNVQAGPQNGYGKLEGQIESGVLLISLNPDLVDNNVFLSANWDEMRLEGKWQYIGFPGIINQGTFLAIRKQEFFAGREK